MRIKLLLLTLLSVSLAGAQTSPLDVMPFKLPSGQVTTVGSLLRSMLNNLPSAPPPSSGTYCAKSVDGVITWATCSSSGGPPYPTWTSLAGHPWSTLTGSPWSVLFTGYSGSSPYTTWTGLAGHPWSTLTGSPWSVLFQ